MKPSNCVVAFASFCLISGVVAAQDWKLTSAPTNWWSALACSADGTKVMAAGNPSSIYLSSDSGITWTRSGAPLTNWVSVACSADATHIIAGASSLSGYPSWGIIYLSTDSGATWTRATAPSTNWSSVASSADGTRLLAVSLGTYPLRAGMIYTSSDYGSTWVPVLSDGLLRRWVSVATSAEGRRAVAAAFYEDGGSGPIYASSDYAATWAELPATSNMWSAVASSADGNYLVGSSWLRSGPRPASFYFSRDAGATWAAASAPGSDWWSCVAASADGSKFIAAVGDYYAGPVAVSTNGGVVWTATDAPSLKWSAVACSADGCKAWAAASAAGIYTSQATPVTVLHATSEAERVCIFWRVPSKTFVLQQTSDPGSGVWTDATAETVLNTTNLNHEAWFTRDPAQRFFRLKSR